MRGLKTGWIPLLVVASMPVGAQVLDYPTHGTLFHPTDASAVAFECSLVTVDRLNCTFSLLDVFTPQSPSVEQRLASYRRPPEPEHCARARYELAESLRTGTLRTPTVGGEGALGLEWLKASVAFCDSGDPEVFRELVTREHERDEKRCTFFAHRYTQTFRRGSTRPGRHWFTEDPPFGYCQVHVVSEFYEERGELYYVAARRVLKKSTPGVECDAKEKETTFTSRFRTMPLQCETVEFSSGCWSPHFPCLNFRPVVVY